MGKRNRKHKNRITQALNQKPEATEAAPQKSEYELLIIERDELTVRYNNNTNFIQKNQILLQKQRVLQKLNEIEASIGNDNRA